MSRVKLIAIIAALTACGACGEVDETSCDVVGQRQLSVYSNNVGIFPEWLVKLYPDSLKKKKDKVIKDEEQRAEALAKVLLSLEGDPDLILLQEIWSIKARDVLIKKLEVEYPHKAHQPQLGALPSALQPSGLMIFSKHALRDYRFKLFTMGVGVDKISQKGVMGVKLTVGGREVVAFTTHLQAGSKDPAVKPDQLKECAGLVSSMTKNSGAVSFIAGDFNISSTSAAGPTMIATNLPGATDAYAASCSSIKKTGRYDDNPAKRIDYLFTFGGVQALSTVIDPAGETISDHLAVWGIVSLD